MRWADSAAAAAMIEILESEPWEFQGGSVHRAGVAGSDREPGQDTRFLSDRILGVQRSSNQGRAALPAEIDLGDSRKSDFSSCD